MAASLLTAEAERMAAELARRTGVSTEEAVLTALRDRLNRFERAPKGSPERLAQLKAIADHCASLPVLDNRTPDEILGYDENGLPT